MPSVANTIIAEGIPSGFPHTEGNPRSAPIIPPTKRPPPIPIRRLQRSIFPVENRFIGFVLGHAAKFRYTILYWGMRREITFGFTAFEWI
jgi:hypothetical protein